MKLRRSAGAWALAAAAAAAGLVWSARPRDWHYAAPAMGSRASLAIVGTPFEKASGRTGRMARAALSEIAEIERLMSIFLPESDIGRLNGSRQGEEVSIDGRTAEVLRAALLASRVSDGAFNVCVLPAEQAWGFKTGEGRKIPPAFVAVPLWSETVFTFRDEGPRHYVSRASEGVRVDLGGIAPGYAADRAAAVLKGMGARGALVDVAGECFCLGRSAGGGPWRVGVRHPRKEGVLTVLELTDRAVATSGDYEDFFLRNGKRYSHIFDPRTGAPEESGVASATVVAGSCMAADALSTALMVMGKDKALRLIGGLPGTECLLVTEEKGRLGIFRKKGPSEGSRRRGICPLGRNNA